MAWVKLDDRYFANGKILKVSPSAVLLHIASMCHCASALNDGEFPLAELGIICAIARVQGPPEVAELVQAGLWDETGQCNAVTGYKVHDFLEYNPPAAKVRADRQLTTQDGTGRRWLWTTWMESGRPQSVCLPQFL